MSVANDESSREAATSTAGLELMENDLPCPKCGNDFQTGPSWNEDESLIWWDCECGLEGPEAQTQRDAIRLWNDMVTAMSSNVRSKWRAACGTSKRLYGAV